MVFREVTPDEEVVRRRVQGDTFVDIAHATGLTAERCAEIFHTYLHESYSSVSEVEMRLTQLKRLESLLSYLWEMVRAGDTLTEGRQTANAIKIIEQINLLMGVHRDPLRDAQVELTRAQTDLVYGVLTHLRAVMLDQLVEGIRPLIGPEQGVPESVSEYLREFIEAKWPSWHATAVSESMSVLKGEHKQGVQRPLTIEGDA